MVIEMISRAIEVVELLVFIDVAALVRCGDIMGFTAFGIMDAIFG
jgi:hypothetical protein